MLRARLRVFRAPDDLAACERYSRSHREVLEFFDLGSVTSSGADWFADPNVLVVLLEEVATGEALGGIRLERAGGARLLPVERALSEIEPDVSRLSTPALSTGAAELCALFSSRRLRGAGLGPFLTRIGMALAVERGVRRLLAICDTRSLEANLRLGFRVEPRYADRGRLRYPRPDLTAYVIAANLERWCRPGRPEYRLIREFRASHVGVSIRRTREDTLQVAWDQRCPADDVTNLDPTFEDIRTSST